MTLEAYSTSGNNGPDTHFLCDPAALLNHSVYLAQNLAVKALSKSQNAWQEEFCGSPAALTVSVRQSQHCRVEQANLKFEWDC